MTGAGSRVGAGAEAASGASIPGIRFRRPSERDHGRVLAVIDEWWSGRRVRQLLPRLWFRHFAATSWLAEREDGSLAGFLVGFVAPPTGVDDAGGAGRSAVIVVVAVDPNLRRRGIGRALVERFAGDAAAAGAGRVEGTARPDERPSVDFARAVGFAPVEVGARSLWGVPGFEDWDGPGEDRVLLVREVG